MARKKSEASESEANEATTARKIQLELPPQITERIDAYCAARPWIVKSAVRDRVRETALAAAVAAVDSDEVIASLFS